MTNPLTQLQENFRALAREVVAAANADPKAEDWTEVVMEARYSPHSSITLRKLRARVGGQLVSIDGLYGDLAGLVRRVRESPAGEPFYGFVLSITGAGAVDIRLNHDPDCYADPAFAAG